MEASPTLGVPLTENFDTLASTGTGIAWTDNSTIPGWYSTRTTYNSGTGSSNTGALYSFGVAGTNPVTDRALGSVGSGSTGTVFHAARLTNNTGGTITSLDISYVGEQWRNGGNTTAHTLTFQYQVADPGSHHRRQCSGNRLDDGARAELHRARSPAQQPRRSTATRRRTGSSISATLAVTVANGQEIWIRWQDPDDGGSDHGLAVDDFSVTAGGSPGDSAPTVGATAPANAATNVPVDSAIVINFSESVNATASAFALECPAGAPQTFAQTASPASVVHADACCRSSVQHDLHGDGHGQPDLRCRHGRSARLDGSRTSRFSFTTAGPPPPVATNVIINELDSDTPGTDAAEFVELYDGGAGDTALDGLVVVFYNGSNDLSYAAFDLDGFQYRRERLLHARKPWRSGRRSRVRSRRVGLCRTARTRSRSSPATRPTSPPARPSPRRISRTPSSTTPTMRTIRDCSRC